MKGSMLTNILAALGVIFVIILTILKFITKTNNKDEEKEEFEKLDKEEREKLEKEKDKRIKFFLVCDFFPPEVDQKTQKFIISQENQETVDKKLTELATDFLDLAIKQRTILGMIEGKQNMIYLQQNFQDLFEGEYIPTITSVKSFKEIISVKVQEKKKAFWGAHALAKDFGFKTKESVHDYKTKES